MNTWDEDTHAKNLKRHGIDLADCEPPFDEPMITSEAYGEQRSQSLGLLNGRVVFAVWTERPTGAHMISVREAERHEKRFYYDNKDGVFNWKTTEKSRLECCTGFEWY